MKIVTSDQMRRIEARSEQAGVSTDTLMENAGLAVARRVRHHLGPLTGVPILVLVGPGNNGGDGLVTARHLNRWGARVVVYICRDRREPDPKLDIVRDMGLPVLHASQDDGLMRLKEALTSVHMVVDAVLGTGRVRPIEGTMKEIFLALGEAKTKRASLRILAMDLPSGLNADTGASDSVCPVSDVTVTLGYPKAGHYAFPGADKVGVLEIEDIGIPSGLDDDVALELMTPKWAGATLPQRPSAAHKGTFGKTMVVCGSRNYVGAAYLAATAATRVGAGLVAVAIPQGLQMAVAAKANEPTYLPLPELSPGVVSSEAVALISDNLSGYDALLIGCGLGQAPGTREMVESLLYSNRLLPPTILDADGLNILSTSDCWWEKFTDRAIVTPHPGEMSRLTGESRKSMREDRVGLAIESAKKWNKVVALKGAHTVVAFPNGRAMLSPFSNPGLASAGTGDVLAGAIAGLLSQGLRLEDAAALGVFIHGQAGEEVRQRLGDTGMVAGDLLPELPRVIKGLRIGTA